jgi:hypothetical protein
MIRVRVMVRVRVRVRARVRIRVRVWVRRCVRVRVRITVMRRVSDGGPVRHGRGDGTALVRQELAPHASHWDELRRIRWLAIVVVSALLLLPLLPLEGVVGAFDRAVVAKDHVPPARLRGRPCHQRDSNAQPSDTRSDAAAGAWLHIGRLGVRIPLRSRRRSNGLLRVRCFLGHLPVAQAPKYDLKTRVSLGSWYAGHAIMPHGSSARSISMMPLDIDR